MVGSCRSCICGHVFEDMKQIGGKRFSGMANILRPSEFCIKGQRASAISKKQEVLLNTVNKQTELFSKTKPI